MSVIDTVYSYGSGEVLFHCFNALGMMFQSGIMESLVNLSLILSLAFVGFKSAFGREKIGVYVKWLMTYLFVVLFLVQPASVFKKNGMTIHIRDIITKKGYSVDHLPPGLVLPAAFISNLGFALTKNFEQVFSHADPSYLPYHQYGTLFGAQVMSEIRNFRIQDPVFAENMESYISNCMMYDVMIGRKYDIADLESSSDIWKLITENASNLRMFNYRNPKNKGRELLTCKSGITQIGSFFNEEDSALGKKFPIFSSMSSQNTKNGIVKSLELSGRFYNNLGVNGAAQLKQILLINAFKDVPQSYGTIRAIQQQNSNWKFTGELAGITLPILHSLFQAILYSIFPIIVGLVFFSERYDVLKRYFEMMIWIELWPILFAILNLIVSVHSKKSGISNITIGNIENITSIQSGYAFAASSLSLMIPTFAYMISKGGVSSFVHMAGSMLSSTSGGSSFASQEVISGNRSFDNVSGNNQSYNNLGANKVNTSGELIHGHMRQSLSDGAIQTDFLHKPGESSRIFQGGVGLSASSGATSINIGSHIQESLQKQLQESSSIVSSESQEISKMEQQVKRQAIDYLVAAAEAESRGERHNFNTSTRDGNAMHNYMQKTKDLHDNHSYTWHQAAEAAVHADLSLNAGAGVEIGLPALSLNAGKGSGRGIKLPGAKANVGLDGTIGVNIQGKFSQIDTQDLSENKAVNVSDDVQNFVETVVLASKDEDYSNSQSNEKRLSQNLNKSYEELKSRRENLALHTNKMHQAQENLEKSSSNTFAWNASGYDEALKFIAEKLDPEKQGSGRIGINKAREIIEHGGVPLQGYITELGNKKIQEMRMPNHHIMDAQYNELSKKGTTAERKIDNALQEGIQNNIGLDNMQNDFEALEVQSKNKLSGDDIKKKREDLASSANAQIENKKTAIDNVGNHIKSEVNKAEKAKWFSGVKDFFNIGRKNKNDEDWKK